MTECRRWLSFRGGSCDCYLCIYSLIFLRSLSYRVWGDDRCEVVPEELANPIAIAQNLLDPAAAVVPLSGDGLDHKDAEEISTVSETSEENVGTVNFSFLSLPVLFVYHYATYSNQTYLPHLTPKHRPGPIVFLGSWAHIKTCSLMHILPLSLIRPRLLH